MKAAALILAALALVALTLFAIGLALPKTRTGTAAVEIAATPAQVMAVLRDVGSQPRWRADVAAVELLSAEQWIERKTDGELLRFSVASQTDRALALSFASSRGYVGQWRGVLTAASDGRSTQLSVEESATIDSAWLRLLARAMFDPDAFAATYLDRLRAEVNRRHPSPR